METDEEYVPLFHVYYVLSFSDRYDLVTIILKVKDNLKIENFPPRKSIFKEYLELHFCVILPTIVIIL